MKCPACGATNPDDSKTCSSCGHELVPSAEKTTDLSPNGEDGEASETPDKPDSSAPGAASGESCATDQATEDLHVTDSQTADSQTTVATPPVTNPTEATSVPVPPVPARSITLPAWLTSRSSRCVYIVACILVLFGFLFMPVVTISTDATTPYPSLLGSGLGSGSSLLGDSSSKYSPYGSSGYGSGYGSTNSSSSHRNKPSDSDFPGITFRVNLSGIELMAGKTLVFLDCIGLNIYEGSALYLLFLLPSIIGLICAFFLKKRVAWFVAIGCGVVQLAALIGVFPFISWLMEKSSYYAQYLTEHITPESGFILMVTATVIMIVAAIFGAVCTPKKVSIGSATSLCRNKGCVRVRSSR